MGVRFFMLQTHYSSTLDFSNEALQASEKGYERLMEGFNTLGGLQAQEISTEDIATLEQKCYEAMNDDFNSPILIAHLFEALRIINSANDKKVKLTRPDLDTLKRIYQNFVFDILGLKGQTESSKSSEAFSKVMDLVIDMRAQAKQDKNFALSDAIRDKLLAAGIQIKDSKEGSSWKI